MKWAAASAPAQVASDPYARAQRYIQLEDWPLAIGTLEALLADVPEHAGALLDLAMLYCRIGNPTATDKALDRLERSFQIPPEIAPAVAQLRVQTCEHPEARTRWQVSLGLGFDTNVNQGSSTRNFALGDVVSPLYVTLDEAFLPRKSLFTSLYAEARHDTSNQGRSYGAIHSQNYASAPQLDDAALMVGQEYTLSGKKWTAAVDAHAKIRNVGGKSYQRTLSVRGQISSVGEPNAQSAIGVEIRSTYAHYPARSHFDSWDLGFGLLSAWRLSDRLNIRFSPGWLYDMALNERPGGDRTGPIIHTAWFYRLTHDSQLYGGWEARLVKGAARYAPPLIKQTQRQERHLLSLGWEKKIDRNRFLRLQYQHTQNIDTIPLYRFTSDAIALYWTHEG